MLFTFAPNTHAQSSNNFSQTYGLLVHDKNQDRGVSRVKTLEVLLKYFSNVNVKSTEEVLMNFEDVRSTSKAAYYVQGGCKLNLFDCNKSHFYPYHKIDQDDYLEWFFKLKYAKNPNYLEQKYPKIRTETMRRWREARRLGLLTSNKPTYKSFQDLLYRNEVVETHLNQPFAYGLNLDYEDINLENYNNLNEIKIIKENLGRVVTNVTQKKNTSKEIRYLRDLKKQLSAFESLEKTLTANPYVLQQRPDMDPEVSKAIRKHGLQQILYSYTYDYSKNAAYRKHNLTTGVKKVHGRVFDPGEVIDFWKILSEKGLWEFWYGWVITGGTEEWQFGGGICGSSSLVFLPSWKSGLEILERSHHSQYFSYLYPMEDIGLDATVYRPRPNLKIRNNTDYPIVFNVTDDKENQTVTVDVIGNSPYKEIRIEGPIFLGRNYVKWVRHFEDFNGMITSEALESRYSVIH